jgi:hypothetical protein
VTATLTATATAARRRVRQIRDALALADDLLAQAYAARDWQALGHGSWEAYCAAELPELRHLKLRAPVRRERVARLHALGASTREVAAATGSSVGQAHNDIKTLTTPPAAPAAPVCKTTRALELVATAGPAGLTVHQLEKRTGWHHGSASAVLHRLAAAGRIDYRRPARRGLVGTYTTGGSVL